MQCRLMTSRALGPFRKRDWMNQSINESMDRGCYPRSEGDERGAIKAAVVVNIVMRAKEPWLFVEGSLDYYFNFVVAMGVEGGGDSGNLVLFLLGNGKLLLKLRRFAWGIHQLVGVVTIKNSIIVQRRDTVEYHYDRHPSSE